MKQVLGILIVIAIFISLIVAIFLEQYLWLSVELFILWMLFVIIFMKGLK